MITQASTIHTKEFEITQLTLASTGLTISVGLLSKRTHSWVLSYWRVLNAAPHFYICKPHSPNKYFILGH